MLPEDWCPRNPFNFRNFGLTNDSAVYGLSIVTKGVIWKAEFADKLGERLVFCLECLELMAAPPTKYRPPRLANRLHLLHHLQTRFESGCLAVVLKQQAS